MANNLEAKWEPANRAGLAKRFSRLGWIGFWVQLALLVVPISLMTYVLFVASPESAQQRGIDLSNYLSTGGLVVLVFTTFWFFRYTRLGRRIADPKLCPPQASVLRTVWIGVWASALGIVFSMLLLINAVGRLLFVLMATPQTGVPVVSPLGGDPATTLSAIDAVSLTSLVIVLAAELMIVAFSLWLLFGVTRPSSESAEDS